MEGITAKIVFLATKNSKHARDAKIRIDRVFFTLPVTPGDRGRLDQLG